MQISTKLMGVLVAAAAISSLAGTGAASADRIDPLTPSGPLHFSTTLQNTPEGASSRISFRSGDATIVNSGVWGGRKLIASGAGEAALVRDGRGAEGRLTGMSVETGWYLTCALKTAGVNLGVVGGYVQAFAFPAGGILAGASVSLKPGEYTKVKIGEKSYKGEIRSGQRVGVRYQRVEMTVNGCVGNTYAYPYVTYTSDTDAFDNSKTMTGQTVYLAF